MRSLVICVMPNCSVSQQRSHQSWYLADCNLCIALCSVQSVNCSFADSSIVDARPHTLYSYEQVCIEYHGGAKCIFHCFQCSARTKHIALHCIACVVLFCIGVLGRLDGGQRIVLFPVFDQNKTYCVQCIAVKHIAVLGQRKILHYMCCIVGRAGWTGGQRRRRQW